jgi:hypothetical protein
LTDCFSWHNKKNFVYSMIVTGFVLYVLALFYLIYLLITTQSLIKYNFVDRKTYTENDTVRKRENKQVFWLILKIGTDTKLSCLWNWITKFESSGVKTIVPYHIDWICFNFNIWLLNFLATKILYKLSHNGTFPLALISSIPTNTNCFI